MRKLICTYLRSKYISHQTVWDRQCELSPFFLPLKKLETIIYLSQFCTSKSWRYLKFALPAYYEAIAWTCGPLFVHNISEGNLVTQGKIAFSEMCEEQVYFPSCLWHYPVRMWSLTLLQPSCKSRKEPKVPGKLTNSFPHRFWSVVKRTFYCLSSFVFGCSVMCSRKYPDINCRNLSDTRSSQLERTILHY